MLFVVSLATAILDYHIFHRLSTTFFTFFHFLFCFHFTAFPETPSGGIVTGRGSKPGCYDFFCGETGLENKVGKKLKIIKKWGWLLRWKVIILMPVAGMRWSFWKRYQTSKSIRQSRISFSFYTTFWNFSQEIFRVVVYCLIIKVLCCLSFLLFVKLSLGRVIITKLKKVKKNWKS